MPSRKIKGFLIRHEGQIYSPESTYPLFSSFARARAAGDRYMRKYGGLSEIFEATVVLVNNTHCYDWEKKSLKPKISANQDEPDS